MALDSSAQRITGKKSTISNSGAGLEVFASRTIGNDEVVEYYYGSVVYVKLHKVRKKRNTCGEGVTQVTPETIRQCTNELMETPIDEDGTGHKLWTVSARICAMSYI